MTNLSFLTVEKAILNNSVFQLKQDNSFKAWLTFYTCAANQPQQVTSSLMLEKILFSIKFTYILEGQFFFGAMIMQSAGKNTSMKDLIHI